VTGDMNIYNRILASVLMMWVAFMPLRAEGGAVGKAAVRGATKGAIKSFQRTPSQALRRDFFRDRITRAKPLPKDRTVFRYTAKGRAYNEIHKGIAPGRHMTSHATRGRPLSPAHAQRRYGLPKKPTERELVRLPAGQPVRLNKVVGGRPGVEEITSPKRVSPDAIKNVVPLRP